MKIKALQHPGFEEIVTCEDSASGLKSIIAIHNARLGPALGGIRMYPYRHEEEALDDVTRLAKAMSYKSAAAHLKLGGGKAVILGDPHRDKSPQLLKAMGKFVDHLQGRYWAAKDAGIVTEDLVVISKETKYVTGLPESLGGSGDPSPWTSQGIIEGLRACIETKLNQKNLSGLTVAIQGIGHVGFELARILHEENAKLILSDVHEEALKKAQRTFKAEIVHPNEIYQVPCDVFAPCALGGVLNDVTIPELKCKIIAGGSNNQLKDEIKHGMELFQRDILYAPDYILNAGGVINIYVRDILKEKDAMPWIKKIGGILTHIFKISSEKGIPPSQVADELTEEILARGQI